MARFCQNDVLLLLKKPPCKWQFCFPVKHSLVLTVQSFQGEQANNRRQTMCLIIPKSFHDNWIFIASQEISQVYRKLCSCRLLLAAPRCKTWLYRSDLEFHVIALSSLLHNTAWILILFSNPRRRGNRNTAVLVQRGEWGWVYFYSQRAGIRPQEESVVQWGPNKSER